MKINNRLIKVAEKVEVGSNIIDVGCDHALLCIYLIKNNIASSCIASDVNEGPLNQAKKNIFLFNLDKKIKIKLGDGIDTIESITDTIIISGMGGANIVNILSDGKNKLSNIKTIILSPNNDSYSVRKNVTLLGYKIDFEEIIYDNGKYYPIIVFSKGKQIYNEEDLLFGYNVLQNEFSNKYYNYLLNKYLSVINDITDDSIKIEFNKKIKMLKSRLFLNKKG